jgi:hypothetical protein
VYDTFKKKEDKESRGDNEEITIRKARKGSLSALGN